MSYVGLRQYDIIIGAVVPGVVHYAGYCITDSSHSRLKINGIIYTHVQYKPLNWAIIHAKILGLFNDRESSGKIRKVNGNPVVGRLAMLQPLFSWVSWTSVRL